MGWLKKLTKPISKVFDKIIPNEIKPALPYMAAFAPFMMGPQSGIMGSSMLRRALTSGAFNLGSQLAQEGSEGEFNPLSASLEALHTYAKPYMSEAIAWERLMDVMPPGIGIGGRGGQTKTGSRVYSITDEGETAFWKSAAHIFKGVEPGAVTTGRKILQGAFGELRKSGEIQFR